MKKLMILAVLAASAFGAQAYTYTFSLDVFNLPKTYHTSYYLRDVESNTILAYATAKDLHYYTTGTSEEPHRDTFLHNATVAAADAYFKNPNGATIFDHTLTDVSSTGGAAMGEPNHWKLTVSFNSDMDPNKYNEGHNNPLQIVAFNEAGDAIGGIDGQGTVGYIQTTPVDVTGGAFTASFTYGSVPEPTSGVLLLLGMAGLALKRKRA